MEEKPHSSQTLEFGIPEVKKPSDNSVERAEEPFSNTLTSHDIKYQYFLS